MLEGGSVLYARSIEDLDLLEDIKRCPFLRHRAGPIPAGSVREQPHS